MRSVSQWYEIDGNRYSAKELAVLCSVTVNTVYRWGRFGVVDENVRARLSGRVMVNERFKKMYRVAGEYLTIRDAAVKYGVSYERMMKWIVDNTVDEKIAARKHESKPYSKRRFNIDGVQYNVQQLSEFLCVHTVSIYRWACKGDLYLINKIKLCLIEKHKSVAEVCLKW